MNTSRWLEWNAWEEKPKSIKATGRGGWGFFFFKKKSFIWSQDMACSILTLDSRRLEVIRYRDLQLEYRVETELGGCFDNAWTWGGEKRWVQGLNGELTACTP